MIKKFIKISKFLTMLIVLIYMVYFSLVVIYFINQSFEVNKFKVFFLIICISSDIGGYTFGKIIGGKKLTKISPKKTYSGLVGSLVLSVIFGYLFYISSTDLILINLNIFLFIILISILSQAGDLLIFILKEKQK